MLKFIKHPLLVALVLSGLMFALLSTLRVEPQVKFIIEATVIEDDEFQLFYKTPGPVGFNEAESVRVEVEGSNQAQFIKIPIPKKTDPIEFRLDIGNNSSQEPIAIHSAQIGSFHTKRSYDISRDFIPNEFIKVENGKYSGRTIDFRYDPYFTSHFDVNEAYRTFSSKQQPFGIPVKLLFSIIVFVAVFLGLPYAQTTFTTQAIFITFFGIILISPVISRFFDLRTKEQKAENFDPKKWPKLRILDDYPASIESYYSRNFGLRDQFVELNGKLKLELFNSSPVPKSLLLGKEGYIFYSSKDDDAYPSYSHREAVQDSSIVRMYKNEIELRKKLKADSITYLSGFWPNKHSIYREMLPDNMRMQILPKPSLADRISNYFKSKNKTFVDVRSAMMQSKSRNQLYYKLDSHWNQHGAYIGYREFCKQTYDKLRLTPYGLKDFDITDTLIHSGDLLRVVGGVKQLKSLSDTLYTFRPKSHVPSFVRLSDQEKAVLGLSKDAVVTINDGCGNKKTVIVYRDSFTIAIIPFLSLHYHKVIYIWQPRMNVDYINTVKPDIVLHFSVERYLKKSFF